MGLGVNDFAASWLEEPAWQKRLKHTADAIRDYLTYTLVTIGFIAISLKVLTTFSSGDLACMVVGTDRNPIFACGLKAGY